MNYHGARQLFIKKVPCQAKDLINMVTVTPDGLWMVSDRIVKTRFFVKFHKSGPAIIFSFSTIMEHVSYPSKKLLTSKRPHQDGECSSGRIMDGFLLNCRFSIFRQISQIRTCKNFQFVNHNGAQQLFIKKAPSQAKDLINMVSVTPDGLWMVSDRIDKSRFFVKFHRSGKAIIFRFLTIMEHVSYASKKLLTQPNTSSRW